jgi:16S rRNA pseudouridine516 synthase
MKARVIIRVIARTNVRLGCSIFKIESDSSGLLNRNVQTPLPPVKLDRILAKHESMGRNRARARILGGQVRVDGIETRRFDHEVDRFMMVELDDAVIQAPERLLHVMLHKPIGVVSATSDAEHPTVIDLIDDPDRGTLHLVGRLDRNTSGLVLLTNDGRWSKVLMDPARKVPKVYRVQTRDPIPPEAVAAFAEGFYFHTEDLVTRPAKLEITGECEARLTLHEGRYHQIKRMFHRNCNRVTRLHREQIGGLSLPADLGPGEWRILSKEEAASCGMRRQTDHLP